ncbi:MFS transporter [Viridibacillus sp. FSL R5-0477]|uniref:Major facilitator transporter n=1 Tax=Viridibacillus arenosi FSL R5-213 TaxID=1227360 RepID=W4F362_9BACL|nr:MULTISPECIES: MFS transporter [Viridibacillus]ETT86757.1 major facilitator transporter [Viridibacillus arenosi FSL R5-213]OMC84424.1 MFS transporter [Viridibacillus sp. FSL H7-0596]OMC89477.1 MFS transporter [Viridibacillus arenosi]
MRDLYNDSRFRLIIFANIASSIGSGITMIAIPWMLVTSENGNTAFGYISICMTIINFLITPFIGNLVDKMNRKKILLISEFVCFLLLTLFTLIGFIGLTYEVWHYTIIYMIGSLYYTIFFPTMFALNQEIFNKDQYKALNGTMEVQSQLSSMIAGALASILLLKWDLHYILLLDVLSYAAAIYFYMKLPYMGKPIDKTEKTDKKRVSEGLRYMMIRPTMFLFLLFSIMPFIGVMVTNYLFPVYLRDVLKASASAYGIESMIYAIGAIIAGMFIPVLARKIGNEKTIILSVITYTIAISLIVLVNLPLYLSLMFFIAVGNSGARVARNSFLMDQIPNEIIGRVDSLFRSIGLLFRIVLLALFTQMISSDLIIYCFIILSGLLIVASGFVILSWKKGFELKVDREIF